MNSESRLRAERLSIAYERLQVVRDLDLAIPDGAITAIVGANASGKSTLLRALARLLRPRGGTVYLDGNPINRLPTKTVARELGILPQGPIAPEGLTAENLVARGRYPHQSWAQRWSPDDERAVETALRATATAELRLRPVDELSGGQRQRVWIAMALAQETRILLLDEPTTYLDLAHQLEVLDLLAELNRIDQRTIVIVLHDLNHAARYADHLVALKNGAIYDQGDPREIVSERMVADVFGVDAKIIDDPVSSAPLCIPISRHAGQAEPLKALTGVEEDE